MNEAKKLPITFDTLEMRDFYHIWLDGAGEERDKQHIYLNADVLLRENPELYERGFNVYIQEMIRSGVIEQIEDRYCFLNS